MSKAKRNNKIRSEDSAEAELSDDSMDDFEVTPPAKKKATTRKRKRQESDEEEDLALDSDEEEPPKKNKKKRAKIADKEYEAESEATDESAGEEPEKEQEEVAYDWHHCASYELRNPRVNEVQENKQIQNEEVKYVVRKQRGEYMLYNTKHQLIAVTEPQGHCNNQRRIHFPFDILPFTEHYSTALKNKALPAATIEAAKLLKFNVTFKAMVKEYSHWYYTWELNIFVNKAHLAKDLLEGNDIPRYHELLKTVTHHVKKNERKQIITNKLHNKTSTPIKIDIPEKQPAGLRTKLFKYQLDAISWMKLIEEKSKTALSTSCTVNIPSTEFTVDMANGTIHVPDAGGNEVQPSKLEFSFSGGVLADEMGLGKTAEVLGLILANPRPLPLPAHDHLIYSKATLVISPNHLAKQWIQEAQKHISKRFKTVLITTMPQYEKITYGEIQNADMVVVSFQFLKNPSFVKPKLTETSLIGSTMALDHSDIQHLYTKNILIDNQNWRNKTGFLFDHFHWHRIVIDEGHETTDKKWNPGMFVYPSNYSWYVTGTPFPSVTAQVMAFSITKFRRKTPVYPPVFKKRVNEMIDELGEKLFIDNLFWRNTKESVKSEMTVPAVVEELLLLEFSEVERAMYRDAQGDLERQRQVCCHLQISKKDEAVLGEARKSLDEVRKLMIENKETLIRSLQKSIWEAEDSLRSDTEKLLATSDKKKIMEFEINIQNTKVRLAQLKSDLNRQSSVLRFFQAIVPNEPQQQECTICFDQMKFASITPCGHMFCDACIKEALKMKAVCPMCREKVTADKVTLLKQVDKKEEPKAEVPKDLKKLIEAHGTKMAHLITYLKNLWANKDTKNSQVIVFSQWDNMLRRIGETLEENGIENVFVRGNVHVRNAAISKFKSSKKVKVIMLSLENAASGINLTEATHVILIDPVAGTKAQAQAIEGQAIGRAHRQGQDHQVTVVRLIVKDTIEHEIYKRNTEVDEKNANEHTTMNLRESNSNLRKSIDNLSSPVPVFANNKNNNNDEISSPTKLNKSGSQSRLNNNTVDNNKERTKTEEVTEDARPLKKSGSTLKNNTNSNKKAIDDHDSRSSVSDSE